jgi:hypothetical protein
MFVGITVDGKMIVQDTKGRYFIAGQYGRPAFNDLGKEIFVLANTYEVDNESIRVQNKVTGTYILENQIKDLKFI